MSMFIVTSTGSTEKIDIVIGHAIYAMVETQKQIKSKLMAEV